MSRAGKIPRDLTQCPAMLSMANAELVTLCATNPNSSTRSSTFERDELTNVSLREVSCV
jgi:hypothetical protein